MKATRLLAVITVFAATAALTGCTSGAKADGPSADQIQAGREVYTRLRTLIEGTPRDSLRGNAVANYLMWNATAECMRERGWDYQIAPYVVGGRLTRPGPPGDITAWADITDDFGIAEMAALAASEGFIADGEFHPTGMENLSGEDEQRWIDDMNETCMSAGTGPMFESYPPDVLQGVGMEFTALLVKVAATPTAQALQNQWVDCLADQGFDAHTKHDGYDGPELWPGFRQATEGRENKGALADAKCRRPLHEHVLADGAADLAAFETTHQDQLADAAEAWRDLRAESDRVLAANR
ncbi:hypothetical protein [Phytomonospora endophytica]|uniref:Uncharacterized protein n=1 Tax=Phytomonospora endophytica TaxID=714109 RepID=A0A841FVE1_9ACTN|nr:hypothetical protein [Phytomonospora endophytica]MBB6037698.1 hypothetical protein [Phytomonospora endophytica]GIG67774.1 hypothetical protein Pen01_40690 [Phytomonospora endophytica]